MHVSNTPTQPVPPSMAWKNRQQIKQHHFSQTGANKTIVKASAFASVDSELDKLTVGELLELPQMVDYIQNRANNASAAKWFCACGTKQQSVEDEAVQKFFQGKEDLLKIIETLCYHVNAPLGNRKLSLWGTCRTKSVDIFLGKVEAFTQQQQQQKQKLIHQVCVAYQTYKSANLTTENDTIAQQIEQDAKRDASIDITIENVADQKRQLLSNVFKIQNVRTALNIGFTNMLGMAPCYLDNVDKCVLNACKKQATLKCVYQQDTSEYMITCAFRILSSRGDVLALATTRCTVSAAELDGITVTEKQSHRGSLQALERLLAINTTVDKVCVYNNEALILYAQAAQSLQEKLPKENKATLSVNPT